MNNIDAFEGALIVILEFKHYCFYKYTCTESSMLFFLSQCCFMVIAQFTFTSLQDSINALGEAYNYALHLSLGKFPSVSFKTLPLFV